MFKTPESEVAKFNYQQDKQIQNLETELLDMGQSFFHMTKRRELARAVKRLRQKTTEFINEVIALSLALLINYFYTQLMNSFQENPFIWVANRYS